MTRSSEVEAGRKFLGTGSGVPVEGYDIAILSSRQSVWNAADMKVV
jgi:hypothetical protein